MKSERSDKYSEVSHKKVEMCTFKVYGIYTSATLHVRAILNLTSKI